MSISATLQRVEQYYDIAPRSDSRVEEIGSLTLFIGTGPWAYYARPRLGIDMVQAEDVERACARMHELNLPQAFEWMAESTPSMRAAASRSGLSIVDGPLLVVADPVDVMLPGGVRLFLVGADDPKLGDYLHLAARAFSETATNEAPGEPGPESSDAAVAHLRTRLADGRTVLMAAMAQNRLLAVGSHHPVVVGDEVVTEIVGVATLPDYRGRGLGAAITAALVSDARQECSLVFLSAGDDDSARVYERVGFAQIGTACLASS
ncbi:MAG: GNAT family N-acetyltransferase [Geodermatophilaceae bacterium]|nr:GNAT family N-acetyltransferase [Geodermatophilaceae bacterium]